MTEDMDAFERQLGNLIRRRGRRCGIDMRRRAWRGGAMWFVRIALNGAQGDFPHPPNLVGWHWAAPQAEEQQPENA